MERRKEIYDKIKNTKISKLTLKQNGEAKTLNLKIDLLNQNVYLSDRALDMLEKLANKQASVTENQTIEKQHHELTKDNIQTDNLIEPKNQLSINNFENSINNNFLEKSIQNQQIDDDQNQSDIISNNGSTNLEINNNQTDGYLCRLCLTKCPHERALHDHVTRIHGGSDSRRKHYLFLNNNNQSLLYDDSNSDTNDEFNNSNSTIQTQSKSTNLNKKYKLLREKQKKQHQQQQAKKAFLNNTSSPKPNVAIRVAKVAYYNNKNSTSASSLLETNKSKIFINGIRGNFFSQERLPLKSCKIKLQLNDQTNIKPKIQANEINKFFRSLLVYIPNEILSLDDLIKPNNLNETEKLLLFKIHSIVLDSKECGIKLYDLKLKLEIKSMNLLNELLDILIKNFLILSVGVCERVYVAHEFCQPWIILSYKNQKGCNYASSADTTTTITINQETNNESLLKQKQYKKVWLIPRPWRYIDGLLNRQMLEKVFESIILFLKMNPKVTFENISSHYMPVLQPIMTLELLEMLQHLNCVQITYLKRECECNLESNFDHDSIYIENKDNLIGNEICLYECNSDAIFILKQIFSSNV